MNLAATTPTATPKHAPAVSISEFLVFKLGAEEYGIDILRVQEIRSFERPTRMANAPTFLLGVINLRGIIVPIIDMRVRFNLARVDYDSFTVVIVLNIANRVVGMVVDAVSDVTSLSPAQLHPVPELSAALGREHLLAIGALENRMLILLDIGGLMSSADMGLVEQVAV